MKAQTRYVTMLINDYRRKAGVLAALRDQNHSLLRMMRSCQSSMHEIETVIRWFVPAIELSGEVEDVPKAIEPQTALAYKPGKRQPDNMSKWVRSQLRSTLQGPPIPMDEFFDRWFAAVDPPYENERQIKAARRRLRTTLSNMMYDRKVRREGCPTPGVGPLWTLRGVVK